MSSSTRPTHSALLDRLSGQRLALGERRLFLVLLAGLFVAWAAALWLLTCGQSGSAVAEAARRPHLAVTCEAPAERSPGALLRCRVGPAAAEGRDI